MSNHPTVNFKPGFGLANPHVQTIMSSVGRRQWVPQAIQQFLSKGEDQIIEVCGVRLKVTLHHLPGAPLISLIPGWLGSSASAYVVSMGQQLAEAGYSVARINLRDHGDTAALNAGLFNSALIDEVVSLISHLNETYGGQQNGLVGFSLGGNFALRVAKRLPELMCLAVCPAINPADTMYQIDSNPVYQKYFVRKWRKTWAAKQSAFPAQYDFSRAMQLNTVSALTDYFVRYHSLYATTDEYFAAYDLSGTYLNQVQAHILASFDDPVIPSAQWQQLPDTIKVSMTNHGGHGAYLSNWRLESWADTYALQLFSALQHESGSIASTAAQ